MALTEVKGRSLGDQVAGGSVVIATVAGPASYATGGFSADIPTDLGVAVADIDLVVVQCEGGYVATYDSATEMVLVYTDVATEVVAATNISAFTFSLAIFVGLTAS